MVNYNGIHESFVLMITIQTDAHAENGERTSNSSNINILRKFNGCYSINSKLKDYYLYPECVDARRFNTGVKIIFWVFNDSILTYENLNQSWKADFSE